MFIYIFNHKDYTFTNKMPFNYNLLFYSYDSVILQYSGASPGFGRGGPRIFFFRFGNLHVAKRHAAHGEAMRIVRGNVQGGVNFGRKK